MDTRVIVYDNQMRKQAILENAFNIGYSKKLNELWTASFSLPADDPKNQYCQPLAYVEIFDQGERVDIFRIAPIILDKSDVEINTYQCEHVLVTLIDDVLFQYHEIGGTGVYTDEVINYVLNKQTTIRWVLGQCEFKRQFLYKWENENLLGSLFSIPKPFLEDYMWIWDTTVFPWVLNLVEINQDVQSYVRYKKNMQGIRREIDPTELCTRLYCLGYGEGVNQLTISEVNNGLPYLDASTIAQFGVISRIFVDRRFEDPESLKARGQAILNELQVPRITYEIDAADISSITNDPVDKFQIGTYTRVIDTDLNMNVKALIVGVEKNDLTGNPGAVTIQIANKPRDVAGSIADLADRQRINEVYAQGATNLDSYHFMDNCDPDYPAVLKFYIPEDTVRINKMTLSYETSAFRAYSKAIEGGGNITETTKSGGGAETTSEDGGDHRHKVFEGMGLGTWDDPAYLDTQPDGGHNHKVNNDFPSGSHNHGNPDYLGTGQHSHSFNLETVPPHTHKFLYNLKTMRALRSDQSNAFWNVGIGVPDSSVDIWTYGSSGKHTHEIKIPEHKHEISLPSHTHNIEYGIFEGPIPDTITVEVDGNVVPELSTNEDDINIIPYLAKDGGGRILRGWHEIKITPNKLGRITANIVTQLFVQSRGGGNY